MACSNDIMISRRNIAWDTSNKMEDAKKLATSNHRLVLSLFGRRYDFVDRLSGFYRAIEMA